MSEIEEFEARISAALDRIAGGTDALVSASVASETDPAALAEANTALEEQRMANAQLEERVRVIGEKQDTRVKELETLVATLKAKVEESATDLARQQAVNVQLRDNNAALRAANAEGLADTDAINAGMKIELDALRGLRAKDRDELDDIIGTLAPLVNGEGRNA